MVVVSHVCGNNPDCDGYELEEGEFKIKGYDGPTIPCDKCDGEMQLKRVVLVLISLV
jgi:DNA topoisomerase-1